ncbi:hypothetical protein [Halomonas sp. hl-4]|uniref:hypothetical protein n=1 Tax=Halomonas sp. hl-4 TaxID=1761789 RepID=UPI000BB90F1A|nr:hypothetical protein [Halomonas sp. hl-4]SNY95551.1 hypothetical protein SAMN04488142_0051 [Halomonas sp. hl-4]
MKISREQAIKETSAELVSQVEAAELDFTNRVTGNGHTEFSASVYFDSDGIEAKLEMLVMVPDEESDVEDLGEIDWEKYIAEAEFEII